MKPRASPPGFRRVRRDRQIQEVVHDSYQTRSKPAEPTLCPDCGALFHGCRRQAAGGSGCPRRRSRTGNGIRRATASTTSFPRAMWRSTVTFYAGIAKR